MPKGATDVLTIILAGGKGERLYPLTKNRTKPRNDTHGLSFHQYRNSGDIDDIVGTASA